MLDYLHKIPSNEKLQALIDTKFDKALSQTQIHEECNKGMYFIDRNLSDLMEEYLYFQGISPQIINQVISNKIECDILAHFLREKPEQLQELNMVLANLSFLLEQPIKLQKLTRTIPFELLEKHTEISKEPKVSLIFQAKNTLNEMLESIKIVLDFITRDYDLEIYALLNLIQEKTQQQLELISTYLEQNKDMLEALNDADKEAKYKEFLEGIDSNFFPNHTEDFQEFLNQVWGDGLDDVFSSISHDMKLFEIRKQDLANQKNLEKDLKPQILAIFDRLKAPVLSRRVDLLFEMLQDIKDYHHNFDPKLCLQIEKQIEAFKEQLA